MVTMFLALMPSVSCGGMKWLRGLTTLCLDLDDRCLDLSTCFIEEIHIRLISPFPKARKPRFTLGGGYQQLDAGVVRVLYSSLTILFLVPS